MHKSEKIKAELWYEVLKKGHTMKYRALGGSMAPFIKNGSILSVKPNEKIVVGDIILHGSNENFVCHRVIGKRRTNGKCFFVTKGDNLSYRDPLVSPVELLGKVVKIETAEREIKLDSFFRRLFNYGIAAISPFFLHRILSLLRKTKEAIPNLHLFV